MPQRSSYQGDTQRFTEYDAPPQDTAAARFDAATPAPIPHAPTYQQPDRNRSGRLLGLGALVVGIVLLNSGRLPIAGGFIERTSTFTQSYTAQQLTLDVGNGDITLSRANGDQIEVEAVSHGYGWTPGTAERAVERIEPRISVEGETLRIEEQRFDTINVWGRSPYVEYRIALPPGVPANVATGSGDLEATAIEGKLQLRTGSGDVRIAGSGGELQLRTGSGDIQVEGVHGSLRADTGSGEISIQGAEADALQLSTGSGNVDFAGSLPVEGAHSISSGSGDIALELPEATDIDLHASTGSGEISLDDEWNADVGESEAGVRLGSGGATLELRTSSGNISVEAD